VTADAAQELAVLVRAGWRVIALESFEEERALRTLGQVAAASKRGLRTWSLASGLAPDGAGAEDFDAGLRAMAACEEPTLFAVLDAQTVLDDARAVRRLRDLLPELGRRRQAVVLVGPVLTLPLELEREGGRVSVPLPGMAELAGLFQRVLEAGGGLEAPGGLLEGCARASLGLTGGEATRVFRKALLGAGGLDEGTVAQIAREKRQALRRSPALSFHEVQASLEDVGGLGELKVWLRERQRAFGEEARRFGLPTPRGILMLGVQGCGKSLCAKAVAREWGFPLVRLDLAAAFGDPARGPELTLREATTLVESLAPVVLWIDEIEKGFAATGEDGRASRVFGAFLTWLGEKTAPVFVTATANDVGRLPPELLRRGRFDELFFVDLPTLQERVEILAIHLRKRGRDPLCFPLEELAGSAERLSGAELEQVVAAGLYTAFAEGRDLRDNDLANAIQETVPLYETYEERIKELRNWARTRARAATLDARMVDLFRSA
jgi:AAA+ superfamily predicted ATPase